MEFPDGTVKVGIFSNNVFEQGVENAEDLNQQIQSKEERLEEMLLEFRRIVTEQNLFDVTVEKDDKLKKFN
jgi:hypothetical protein